MAGVDSNTKLLLHFNGTNGSTTVSDSSPAAHGNATVAGNAQLTTADKVFGTASLTLDGTGDYIYYADHADWDIVGSNTDDWTIDIRVKLANTSANNALVTQVQTVNSNEWRLIHNNDTRLAFYFVIGGTWHGLNGGSITDNNWHHAALCKVGSTYGLYLDGTQTAYLSDSGTATYSGSLGIGALDVPAHGYDPLSGKIDELRIQHSNIFGAAPNVGETDTITVPTDEYAVAAGPANLKTLMGVAKASIKTVNGLAIASVKKVSGVA